MLLPQDAGHRLFLQPSWFLAFRKYCLALRLLWVCDILEGNVLLCWLLI